VEKSILIYFCHFFAALFIRGWAKGVLKYSKALMMMGKHGKVLKPSSLSLKKILGFKNYGKTATNIF